MQFFRTILFATFFTSAGFIAWGQDAQERLNRLLSEDFARSAQEALETGDRAAAIIAALRGLPANPTEADMTTYEAASRMLFRAVASRAMRIDRRNYQSFSLNVRGDRAVIGPGPGIGMDTPDSPLDPYILVDPRTGQVLTELLPGRETHRDGSTIAAPIPFSPDGSSLAILSFRTGNVHVFDSLTGAEIRVLSGLSMTSGELFLGGFIGYSPDGSRFGAHNGRRLLVWDLASGQATAMSLEADGASLWPIGWAHDGGILVNRRTRDLSGQVLEHCSGGTCRPLTDLIATFGGASYMYPSQATPHLMALTSEGLKLLDWSAGQVVPLPVSGSYVGAFVRDGAALALYFPERSGDALAVFDLTGVTLDAIPTDQTRFDHSLHTTTGEAIGGYDQPYPNAYAGTDIPTGLQLYEYVWTNLPAAIQAEVDADRVGGS